MISLGQLIFLLILILVISGIIISKKYIKANKPSKSPFINPISSNEESNSNSDITNAAILMIQTKSFGLGVVLTFLFGGLGLFYTSIVGGIVMTIIEIIALIITIVTAGFGIVFFIPARITTIIWAVVVLKKHNDRLILGMNGKTTPESVE